MDFLKKLFHFESDSCITGLTDELNVFYVLHLFQEKKKSVLVVANSLFEANKFYDALSFYSKDVCLFPMDDFLTSVAVAVSPELKIKRLETLERTKKGPCIVVTNLMGYLRFLPCKEDQDKLVISLKPKMQIRREEFEEVLQRFGYHRESLVTSTGEYAVRGYIVDLFLLESEHPIRIEFFGNEIDSIRYFDESSQLSIGTVKDITILPYAEIETKKHSSIVDYLEKPYTVFLEESQIKAGYGQLQEEIMGFQQEQENAPASYMFSYEDVPVYSPIYLNHLEDFSSAAKMLHYDTKEIENFRGNFSLLKDFAMKQVFAKKKVIFCLSNENQVKKIQELFDDTAKRLSSFDDALSDINVIIYRLHRGFILDSYCVISEYDIEETKHAQIHYKNSYHIGRKIKDFNQIQEGDYVVHMQHGIGIYAGVITLTKNGLKKDYIQINYQGNDRVYIPVEKITSIYKYASQDGTKPKIHKLNSASWANTKRQLRKKLEDISKELLALYAKRASIQGPVFAEDPLEKVFASDFTYELTRDQDKAIGEIEKDLSSAVPMDRLLCGDVGFGKTEVAFRAMFRTLMNGKQVSYLCPTTILSKQQYMAAKERFSSFPVEMALLNRFTPAKEVKRILEGLATGKIDMVFGTHRLLSKDVVYEKLGLLIVDEEQRFGVTHKEKIKELKNDVNVLTLSATPIPRTLKMALSGLRDLSIIDTPPVNRYPVQTYVLAENDLLIKDAIYKELSRKGQVFILYNQVSSIEGKVEALHRLVPEARITYAHGQMSKKELEDVMQSFIDYEYDILVCTTIIETGIDIANANTLIIYDADHFGLSQLYQIRGRVGRTNKIAYAYLMYNPKKVLNEVAIKRLEAIKEFTELGSGYRIAMRDLSIRGAGDLLGSEQAGFVDSVGIDLYMKMLENEIKKQNGEAVEEEEEENTSLIEVETHIDDAYVNDKDLKIEIHQKINEVDGYQSLQKIKAELEDRFGPLPQELEVYMYEEWFEKLAKELGITRVVQNERMVEIALSTELSNIIKADKLFMQSYSIAPKLQFKYLHKNIILTLPLKGLEKHFVYYIVPVLELVKEQKEENSPNP